VQHDLVARLHAMLNPALLRGLRPTDRAQRPVNCAAHGKLSGAPAATLIVATSALNDLLLAADNTVSRLIRGNLHYRLFCLAAWACRSGLDERLIE